MILQKWNYKTHKYEDFASPASNPMVYHEDLHDEIDCTNCGQKMIAGNAFTSMTIHDDTGFGYPVCDE